MVARKPASVLVVDDDPQIVKLFTRLLQVAGYNVSPASSGAQALRAMQEGTIDLVVLDLSMPPPDGVELLGMFRKGWPDLRILVVSGIMQGAELLGATASLAKTDAPQLLVATVDRLLSS
jgi:two-component system, NtrC family, response regulator GlrR